MATISPPPEAPPAEPGPTAGVEPRLELPGYGLEAALRLERHLGLSHVVSQILVRRGLEDPEAARAFLAARERHDPGQFAGLDRALEVLWGHLRGGRRIVVHGDYDVDGVCATAVLVRALQSLGGDVGWYLPSRHEDGYGLAAATVERLARSGAALLVTVDCGITAVDEVQCARTLGLDVVITDHHAPRSDGQLPDCPIVHPAVCRYPTSDLCGTAVAHKLAEALGAPTAGEDLELVALATVADLVPLQGENRRIVREGLLQMASTRRPGLRALMAVSRTDPSGLDASCLAFRLAPRINAAGRMRRADAGLELLLTDEVTRAEQIARELDAVNAERRATEQQITHEALALAAEMGERSAYVLAAPGWHAGVIGIVASKVVERHHRPTIMLALEPGAGGAPAHGSGRSIPGFDLLGALHATGEHLLTYGGHRAAAGLSLPAEQIDAFRAAFERHAAERLTPEMLAPVERLDAVVSAADMSLELAEELAVLAPFGNGNPEVRLYVPGATFGGVRALGEGGRHLRFDVASGGGRASAVAFGCDGRLTGADGGPVDASFTLERNVWNGVVEPRLILRRAAPCEPAPIGLLGEPDDFLASALMELDRELAAPADLPALAQELREELTAAAGRVVVDRRGASPLATIADAQAAAQAVGEHPLVVCADGPRRLTGLGRRRGGVALISHESLLEEPEIAAEYHHIVVLDPPASAVQDAMTRVGDGYAHLAWGAAELRFAQQIHELEYGLRASLVALYRALRERRRVTGEGLERLLRGDGPHARSARLVGRMLRVFTELELASLDPDLPALTFGDARPTELERSPAYGVYAKLYEDGQQFLSALTPRPAS